MTNNNYSERLQMLSDTLPSILLLSVSTTDWMIGLTRSTVTSTGCPPRGSSNDGKLPIKMTTDDDDGNHTHDDDVRRRRKRESTPIPMAIYSDVAVRANDSDASDGGRGSLEVLHIKIV
ncbi:hypothetical protein ZHAS_00011865 [Anopheles sinensis]|uniref:Uncharacterized protein n=1 Tax=Anopheles sinensis TaxID=74873 RepID=A0A084W1C5_ANOSI|nr:hypothetical protein ZHAS_00011865 [Anopheles sinensis]